MAGGLTYDKLHDKKQLSPNEKVFTLSKDFPDCKGLYPDCPEKPDLMNSMCRTCPKTDGIKKPKLNDE